MLEFLDANRRQNRNDRICACSFAIRSAVLPSVQPKDEKPTTDIAAAPITAPQIPGFRLGYLFINCASMSGDLSPDLAAADRGPERKFARYPTGHLGLRRINHTRFRGTEYCAADQFSKLHIVSLFCPRKRSSVFLRKYRYATDLNSRRRFFLRRDIAGEAVIRMADGFASVSPRRQIPSTDPRGKLHRAVTCRSGRGRIFNI